MPRMPSQKRSLMGRICRACKAFFDPLHLKVLPLSHGEPVVPSQTCCITGRTYTEGFWPERLTISNFGTKGGAADWLVNDIRIDGKSQFIQAGDIPGDVFATNAVSSFVCFEAATASAVVEIVVTYIGENAAGCPFYGAFTGPEYDPGLLDIVRGALSQAIYHKTLKKAVSAAQRHYATL